jgi:predicted kinase
LGLERTQDISDATVRLLQAQLNEFEEFIDEEHVLCIDTAKDYSEVLEALATQVVNAK